MTMVCKPIAELRKLRARGARWLVVGRYGDQFGELISWHRTYDAAARKAGTNDQIADIQEVNCWDDDDSCAPFTVGK